MFKFTAIAVAYTATHNPFANLQIAEHFIKGGLNA